MRGIRKITLLCAVLLMLPLPAMSQGAEPEFLAQTGSAIINLDDTVSASQLSVGLVWYAPAYASDGGSVNSLQCLATARRRGELVRGMTLALAGEIFAGSDAETLNLLSRKSRPFNPAARFSWDLPDYSATESAVGIMLSGDLSGGQQVDLVKVDCRALNRRRCESDRETLCAIGNRRFKVQLDFGSGQGRIAARTPRSALFSVSDPSVTEVIVELFDRCQLNSHFWVAVASVSPVPFAVVVEDTLSGETRSFSNPGVGMVEVDTAAFPTCP